jgi:hypothetical protein
MRMFWLCALFLVSAHMMVTESNAQNGKQKTARSVKRKDSKKQVIDTAHTELDQIIEDESVPPPMEILEEVKIDVISREGVKAEVAVDNSKNRTPFGKEGKYFLVRKEEGSYYVKLGIEDTSGKIILPVAFQQIEQSGDFVKVRLGNRYGIMDKDFKLVLPVIYQHLVHVSNTSYFIINDDYSSYRYILVDAKGNKVLPGDYQTINQMFTYYNTSIDKSFLVVGNKLGKMAVYDVRNHKFVLPFEFDNITEDDYNVRINKDGQYWIFNTDFKPVIDKPYDQLENLRPGIYRVKRSGRFGLVTYKGGQVLPIEYNKIEAPFSSLQVFIVQKNKEYRLMDATGRDMFNRSFEYLEKVSDDKLLARQNGKAGLLNVLGTTVLPFRFDNIILSYKGIVTRAGNTYEQYDLNGVFERKLPFSSLEKIGYNRFIFASNGKKGVLNQYMNVLIPAEYDSLEIINIQDREQFKVFKNNKCGVISQEHTVLVPLIYDDVRAFDYNRILLVKDGKYGLMDKSGRIIRNCNCDYLSNDSRNSSHFICVDGNNVIIISN